MSFKIGDMSKALKMLMANYSLSRKSQSYVNGELVDVMSEPETIFCAVIPLGAKELRNLPEGEFDSEDKTIITDGSIDLALGDQVTAFGGVFEIRRKTDVSDIVNLKTYVGKKV